MKRNSSIIMGIAGLAMGVLATAAFATSPYVQYTTTLGPTHYWQLEDPNGASLAQDSTGNATLRYYNGVINSKSDMAGIVGRADALGAGASNTLDTLGAASPGSLATFDPGQTIGTGCTVEFWLKPTAHTAGPYLVTAGDGQPGSYGLSYKFADASGSFFSLESIQYFGNDRILIPNDGIVDGQWNFVVLTMERTALNSVEMTFYSNGQFQPANQATFTDVPADLGAWGNVSFGGGIAGGMDEIAIFDRALTPQEVLNQFDATIPEPGLLSLLALGGAVLVWRRNAGAKRA